MTRHTTTTTNLDGLRTYREEEHCEACNAKGYRETISKDEDDFVTIATKELVHKRGCPYDCPSPYAFLV